MGYACRAAIYEFRGCGLAYDVRSLRLLAAVRHPCGSAPGGRDASIGRGSRRPLPRPPMPISAVHYLIAEESFSRQHRRLQPASCLRRLVDAGATLVATLWPVDSMLVHCVPSSTTSAQYLVRRSSDRSTIPWCRRRRRRRRCCVCTYEYCGVGRLVALRMSAVNQNNQVELHARRSLSPGFILNQCCTR